MNAWLADLRALPLAAVLLAGPAATASAATPVAEGSPTPLTAPATTAGGRPDLPRVQAEELQPIDPATVGTLDERRGGFGIDMWSCTKLPILQRVLPTIPVATASRPMRSLARRLLLTPAAIPPGTAVKGADILKIRAERLFAMGATEDLLSLLALVPAHAVTPELQALKLDAELLLGDLGPACQTAQGMKATPSPVAAKARILCDATAGRAQAASFALDILREQAPDAAFLAAAETLLGTPAKLDSLPQPQPIHVAALRAAKMAFPLDMGGATQPAVLRAIALSAEAPQDLRLRAAEAAEALGALDPDLLRQIYSATTFTQAELAQPISDAGPDRGARSRALLFRAAQLQTNPAARAEVVARALSLAKDGPYFFTTARTYAPLLAPMRPAADLVWFSGHAARALLAAGQIDEARAWLILARHHAATNPDAAAVAGGLEPLFRIALPDSGEPIGREELAAWRKARPEDPTGARRNLLAAALAAVDVAGPGILPPADTASNNPNASRLAISQGLQLAAEDLRLAETVMLALETLGDSGTSHPEPLDLYRAVHSLRHVGLDVEARAVALEAVIAAGG